MAERKTAEHVWVWIHADGTCWKLARTADGYWHCTIGLGGKRLGAWESGLPPGLETLPKWLENR